MVIFSPLVLLWAYLLLPPVCGNADEYPFTKTRIAQPLLHKPTITNGGYFNVHSCTRWTQNEFESILSRIGNTLSFCQVMLPRGNWSLSLFQIPSTLVFEVVTYLPQCLITSFPVSVGGKLVVQTPSNLWWQSPILEQTKLNKISEFVFYFFYHNILQLI